MKSFLFAAAFVSTTMAGTASADVPEVGDKAPDFKLQASDGKEYSLSDFAGKRAVVIAWFPKAFTRGCTAECKDMRANGEAIRQFDVAYFTASVDNVKDNTAFAKSLQLDFPILSDPTKETAKNYGVLNPQRGMANRWTFYIGPDGNVLAVDQQVKAAQHGRATAQTRAALALPKIQPPRET